MLARTIFLTPPYPLEALMPWIHGFMAQKNLFYATFQNFQKLFFKPIILVKFA